MVDYLELQVNSHTSKHASLYIESGYLSLQYGSRVRLLGMPNRLREIDDDTGYCYQGTPTPQPPISCSFRAGRAPGHSLSTLTSSPGSKVGQRMHGS